MAKLVDIGQRFSSMYLRHIFSKVYGATEEKSLNIASDNTRRSVGRVISGARNCIIQELKSH